jgi:hypothetical protein
MTVVSSFTAADLDPTRLKARGAVMLRDFLVYAAHGGAQPAPPAAGRADPTGELDGASQDVTPRAPLDPLIADLAFRLRSEGLEVHPGYGTSAQRLDLAVEDPQRPGRVLVAVESDGLRYAAMSSTRDRDRLRIEQLRRLGWEHVRVWSTDLFRDPARDVARVIAAVRAASAARPADLQPSDAHRAGVKPADVQLPDIELPDVKPAGVESAGVESADVKPAGVEPADSKPDDAKPADSKPGDAKPADSKPHGVTTRSKPEQTRDDTDAGWGERPNEDANDQWLRDQRPPHWG